MFRAFAETSKTVAPAILVGDRILVNKLAYDLKVPFTTLRLAKWAEPQRGDIVVFYSPEDGKRLIKRIVGLPGDTVAMHRNRLFINGRFLKYEPQPAEISHQTGPYGQAQPVLYEEHLPGKPHAVMFQPARSPLDTFDPVRILPEKYFMLGDSRDNSADSRYFGFVDRKLIVGRVKMVVMSRQGSFLHLRWYRFFKDLS